jgi:RND family efflux transporter MFP subunit
VVGSAVDGRVVEFAVNEGDQVKQGQKLAQLLTGTIDIEVAAAEAQLALRTHELAELRAGTREEEKAQAQARAAAAAAVADYARRKLRRIQDLAKKGSATADELEEAISAADNGEKLREAAQAALDLANAGPRKEQVLAAEARLEAARQEVERLKDIREKYTIVAPFDGYVAAEHTEIGQWINRGDPVAEIVELSELEVALMVLESHVPHLTVGTSATVEAAAFPGQKFRGNVLSIAPLAELRSRSFPVKVRLENPRQGTGHLLKAGMFAQATLPVGKPKSARLVPRDALVMGGPKPIVFVVEPPRPAGAPPRVRAVPVEIGVGYRDWVEVVGEVQAGQQVVAEGNERRRSGDEIQVIAVRKGPAESQ